MSPQLTADDAATLGGERGPAAAFAMRVLTAFAGAVDAASLIDISRAHIDGCLYHGQVSLDFVERLVASSGRVAVPTTLNVGALDLIHPELIRMSAPEQEPARRLMRMHEALGCVPSFTCAPYQTSHRPAFGEQIAWGESNAIVFANSVIGARTNRYADFIDLCCAMTGRAPAWGLHLEENRVGQILFRLTGFRDSEEANEALFAAVGLIVGTAAGDRIPVIEGLPRPCTEDHLKALGAAAATSGSVALFHAVGITPEAPTLSAALDGRRAETMIEIRPPDVSAAIARLSTVPDGAPLTAVCLGTPHFSLAEWTRLAALLDATPLPLRVPLYVNTGRDTLDRLGETGTIDRIRAAGVIVVTDTCTYLTPILERLDGAVMTNSGKWAYYAPGNLGVEVAFGDLRDCVASAAAGRVLRVS